MNNFTEKLHESEGLAYVVDDLNNRLHRNNLRVKGLPKQELKHGMTQRGRFKRFSPHTTI